MSELFGRHRGLLERAVQAIQERTYWTAFSEVPSGKIYGEPAKADGAAAFEKRLGKPFNLANHPAEAPVGNEVSPYGRRLGITYPAASINTLTNASQAASGAWAAAEPEVRVGVCLEALVRLNNLSFEIANAVMHTTGQAFAMAFQAGGPHAQERGLEAVAYAYSEMKKMPSTAVWSKPQGKSKPIVLEKHWRVVPKGVSVVIGCNTFPTWNSYPGLFASLACGNTVILKPHPAAILPLAITVDIIRHILAEQGLPEDAILLAPDVAGSEITQDLLKHPAVAIIDYTGSNSFGEWVRNNVHGDVYTEEGGINSVVIGSTEDFVGMCDNLAFSLSLYSGQMCTSPQNLFIPSRGIETNEGSKTFDEVANGIASAVNRLLADPARAAGVCGAIANPATLDRVSNGRTLGRLVRDSSVIEGQGEARTATPLIVAVESDASDTYGEERFGPISFVIPVDDARDGINRAAALASKKGAITAALYSTDDAVINFAADQFARAGVNLSVNLTGGIFVNQSAAFSDFHVTGANPAGNASLTDAAFVANRFRVAMWRKPFQEAAE
ncbi:MULTISPECIES: phenylacetic acid degradation protein PaaN [Rhizobium/Agrobacterium group]|uniref:phenylacetic acid degradation protein PaaN n=1 Tax=Rhizobium/Agrobacterium group TaxID=227290 RepID=UPI00107F5943|nr:MULTISPECIES: phenylacetic acid degradation protein PaaN [Rhizobium/Agrobacterium group]TGE86604.1 phenylacetic acid degradation protein PaaN [Rhizobium sp. SEMIA 4032]